MKTFISFRLSLTCLASIVIMLFVSSSSHAQGCTTIYGRVTTSGGAIIPGADIRLINSKAKEIRHVQTDDNGEYLINCPDPGVYDVFADSVDFRKTKRKSIKIQLKTRYAIDFVLKRH